MSDPLDTPVPGLAPSTPPNPKAPRQTDFGAAYQAMDRQGQDVLAKQSAGMAPAIDKAQGMLAEPRPQPPKLEKSEPAPKFDMSKDGESWIKANAMIAGLFGAFSRRHATTALNAFGAGLKGFSEGNLQKYEQNFKTWKASSDEVVKSNNSMLTEYNNVLNDRKMGIEEQMSQIQLIASKYKDPLAYQAASAKNFTNLARVIEQQEAATQQFQQHTEQLEQNYEIHQQQLAVQLERLKQSGKIPGLNTTAGIKQFSEWYDDLDPAKKGNVDHIMGMAHPGNSLAQLLGGAGLTPAAPGAAPAAGIPKAAPGAPGGAVKALGDGTGMNPQNASALPAGQQPITGRWYNTAKGIGRYEGGGFFTSIEEATGPDQAGVTQPIPPAQ